MKVTVVTKRVLEFRRHARAMEAAGYRYYEPDWTLTHGHRVGEAITNVQIDLRKVGIWIKSEEPTP